MLLVVPLCFILSLCDQTHQATRVVRNKRLIYTDLPDGDGYSYSVNKLTDKGYEGYDNKGYNGHEGYHGNEEYHGHIEYNDIQGHTGLEGHGVNEEYHGNDRYNGIIVQKGLEGYSNNNGYNGNDGHIGIVGYNPSGNLDHNENTGYNQNGNYNPKAHNEVYDPNGHAIAILYEGPHSNDDNSDHEILGSGQQLNPYGTVQNNGITDQIVGQPNPWTDPIQSDNADLHAKPSSSIVGRDAQVEIRGTLHKLRLPDFVLDSSNPQEKFEALKQDLKNRENGDHANGTGKENNDNMVKYDKNNIDTDHNDKNNQNYKNSDYSSEKNSEEEHIGKVNIHFGKVNKLNIQVGDRNDDKKYSIPSYSREEKRDRYWNENESVPSYSRDEKWDRYVNKNIRVSGHSREENDNIYGDQKKRVSSSDSEHKVSAYGRVYDDNSESKESKKISKDEETNLEEDV